MKRIPSVKEVAEGFRNREEMYDRGIHSGKFANAYKETHGKECKILLHNPQKIL